MSEQPQLEAADSLAEAIDGNEEALAEFVEHLDEVNDLLDILALGSAAVDDEMVVMLAETANNVGTLADTATEPETVRGLESVLHAVGDAAGDLDEPPERLGPIGLLRALRDPEVQAGLGFLVAVSKGIGRDLERRSEMRQGR
ncbi:MAG TPA: DUF1641 domain-containing protein [Halobacteriales archaeon]|nr:DUF1641 domain-containing protein [Halobacteriales archaeon]